MKSSRRGFFGMLAAIGGAAAAAPKLAGAVKVAPAIQPVPMSPEVAMSLSSSHPGYFVTDRMCFSDPNSTLAKSFRAGNPNVCTSIFCVPDAKGGVRHDPWCAGARVAVLGRKETP